MWRERRDSTPRLGDRQATYGLKCGSASLNPLEMKRLIIANLADDDYIGHQAYWQTQSDKKAPLN